MNLPKPLNKEIDLMKAIEQPRQQNCWDCILQLNAIALFQQNILLIEQAAQVIAMDVDDFYQILVDRGILTPPSDPDDDPNELILAHLRISLQQAKEGNLKPVSELWDGIDD